jgi:N-acetylneuraminic acid mutarotase
LSSDTAANVLGNKIIVTGGCSVHQICPPGNDTFCFCGELTNKTEAFNPLTGQWTTLADMPRQRYRHAAVASENRLYVFGGRDVDDNIIEEVDVYDATFDKWVTLTVTWPNATSDLTAVLIGTVIYASGGYTLDYGAVNTTATYDTEDAGATWNYGSVSPMHYARGDCCSVYLDEKIWVFGGFQYTDFCIALDTLEVYDPTTNEWDIKAPLHYPRGDSACGKLFF